MTRATTTGTFTVRLTTTASNDYPIGVVRTRDGNSLVLHKANIDAARSLLRKRNRWTRFCTMWTVIAGCAQLHPDNYVPRATKRKRKRRTA